MIVKCWCNEKATGTLARYYHSGGDILAHWAVCDDHSADTESCGRPELFHPGVFIKKKSCGNRELGIGSAIYRAFFGWEGWTTEDQEELESEWTEEDDYVRHWNSLNRKRS